MGKHLVLAGSGHAHLFILSNLGEIRERGHQVTVVSPSDFYYHPGMGPGVLGGSHRLDAIRFATRHAVEKNGGRFISGYIKKADPQQRIVILDTGESISYDAISFCVGSRVPRDILIEEGEAIVPIKPIENLLRARAILLNLLSTSEKPVVASVVGGGPSACEIAGNLFQAAKRHGGQSLLIHLFAGQMLLERFPDRGRGVVRQILAGRGIEIVENSYVTEVKQDAVILDPNQNWPSDLTLIASGLKPVPIFKRSGLTIGPEGALPVSCFLQNPEYPEIFGGGDCIYLEKGGVDKVWIGAMRQGRVLFHNLMAFMEGRPLKPFDPMGNDLLALNLGDKTGLLMGKNRIYHGYIAFLVKEFFDKRFMRTFKAMK